MHSRSNSPNMAAQSTGCPGRQSSEPLRLDPPAATIQRGSRGGGGGEGGETGRGKDLSRDDLLFLLSILEGELQARDEVIAILKADTMDLALLESHYGFVTPQQVLRALQRDSVQAQACEAQPEQAQLQDVYEQPMAELDHLVETQRQSYRQMLEQLVQVERSHSGALCRLEEQDRNHRVFIQESDDLTNLLEQDRERLKLLIVQEKAYQKSGKEESKREVSALKEELTKLKSFALLVVDEQQRLTEQLTEQSQRVQELTTITDHAQQELNSTHSRAKEEELKSLNLEAELRDQASRFHLDQEAMTAKLANEEFQNQQLRQRLVTLSRQLDELEGTRGALRRAEEELQELRDRVSRGEEGSEGGSATPSLLSEVEQLRRRVVEMEGKDEEMIRMGDQCRDLDRKLGRESSQSRSLKAEVDKLNGRISELDRLEESLGKSRQECSSLKGSLEREKGVTRQLSGELDSLRVRVKELEAIESQLERTEGALRQDLSKLRTLTVVLVEERKAMAERLRQMEEKLQAKERTQQTDQDSGLTVNDKLIEESQRVLRSKADLEKRVQSIAKERDELWAKLKAEEEKSGHLQSKVSTMKKRLEVLEVKEGESCREKVQEKHIKSPVPANTNHCYQQEDNKVRELTKEVERLRKRLVQKGMVEGELMKAEVDYESLERRCCKEQERARALMEELEDSRRELSKYQLAEKRESNQEHLLLGRLQEEQAKCYLLNRDVAALREKVQRLMGTDESICQVQMDHSTLQRRLTQQEVRNRELAREMEGLTCELERYRRFSKSLRPGMNGRRFSDLHISTKEVQTEPEDNLPPDYRSLAPLVLNGKLNEEIDEEDPNQNEDLVLKCISPPLNNVDSLNNQNNNMRRYSIPSAHGKDNQHPLNGKMLNGNLVKKGDVVLTHTPGQPLHIKVTPDHGLNTAKLEISSPTANNATSYTSTAVIPTSGTPPKQRITIIQNSALSSSAKTMGSPPPEGFCSPDRALSPLFITPVSRVGTPNSFGSVTPDHTSSPVQIVMVSTGSPEPTEIVGQAVFRVSPERQNGWQLQRSNSTGPSVITTDDNKIHIHLGSPYIQALNGITHGTTQPGGPYDSPGQEPRTPVLTNGCHIKGSSKITSSITIAPATSPVSQPSHIKIPLEAFRKPGPTRIPKPKSYGTPRGTHTGPNKGHPSNSMQTGRKAGQSVPNRNNATTTTRS